MAGDIKHDRLEARGCDEEARHQLPLRLTGNSLSRRRKTSVPRTISQLRRETRPPTMFPGSPSPANSSPCAVG